MKANSLFKRMYDSRVDYLMLSFWLIPFIVLFVVPIASSFILSLTNFNFIQTPQFIGLSNYTRMLLSDDVFMIGLKNTLIFALITGPLGYLLSFMLAWFINDFGPKTRSVLTLLFYAPSLIGNMVFIWMFIFADDAYGLVNSTLMRIGLLDNPVFWLTDPKYNMIPVIVVLIWMSMGAGFLAFVAGFKNLNAELVEAANIDGLRNRWQELWYITLPQLKPQLLIGAILSISGAFSVGSLCMTMTGFPSTDYSTHTLLVHILDHYGIRYELGYASSLAVVLFLIMILTWNGISKLMSTISDS